VGLPIVLRLFSIFGEIWFLAVVGGTELVCLDFWGISLLQLTDSWLAGQGVVGACLEVSVLIIMFLKTVSVAYCSSFFIA